MTSERITNLRGVKGDTGIGLAGEALATADLNSITTPGVYRQQTSANATMARNYPMDNGAWVVEVLSSNGVVGTGILQRATRFWQAGWQQPYGMWLRSLNSSTGTWSSWRFDATQRINNPADQPGVEVFIWDDTSSSDRQIAVEGIGLGSADLNTVRVVGTYYQTSNTVAGPALNYPSATSGILEVFSYSPGNFLQRYTPNNANMYGFWQRRYNLTAWSPWRFVASQRIDQTAGRAIYTWDDANNREQLIYGDTGWRDVVGNLLNGWAGGSFAIRRIGQRVMLRLSGITAAAAVAGADGRFYDLPSGFQTNLFTVAAVANYQGTDTKICIDNTFLRVAAFATSIVHAPGGRYSMIEWITDQTWPTTLPGTAVGTIPNV